MNISSLVAAEDLQPVEIHVSIHGTDINNEFASIERPLKTLVGARDFIKSHNFNSPVNVIFHEGEYVFETTTVLGADNSGTALYPITYKAADGEKVIFTGSKKLDVTKFSPVTDKNILDRLYTDVKGRIRQLDLREQGISERLINFTVLHDNPLEIGENIRTIQFYLNDKPQRISRWPNEGYNLFSNVTVNTSSWKQYKTVAELPVAAYNGATVCYSGNQPSRWLNAKNMFLEGFFANDYHGEWAAVKNIDTSEKTITTKYWLYSGAKKDGKWAAVNLLEEIDIPGEWYIDEDTGILYYYPPYELSSNDKFEISYLDNNLIRASGVEYLTFENIEFAKTAPAANLLNRYSMSGGNGISFQSSNNITIRNCIFRDIGTNGIALGDSKNILIEGCTIYNTGMCGVLIYRTGDSTTLTSGNVVVKNNHIFNVSRVLNNNLITAILIHGDNCNGVEISNNIIHDAPAAAIRYKGSEHNILRNEIFNVVNGSGDAGAIYCGRSWGEYGTKVTHNFIHDIGIADEGWHFAAAMYFDDGHSGNTFTNNIVYMNNKIKSRCVMINNGRDNIVSDNIFLSSLHGVYGGKQSYDLTNLNSLTQYKGLISVPYDSQLFINKYPGMYENYLDLQKGNYIRKNTVTNNVCYDLQKEHYFDSVISSPSTITNNLNVIDSVFVNKEQLDFRVKSVAKAQYGLSDGVLDEGFDINSIGALNIISVNTDFTLTFPQNNRSNISPDDISLVWEPSVFADVYEYTIANDKSFSSESIILSGTTKNTSVKLNTALENNKRYYWKVKAVCFSRRYNTETECDLVFTFSTNSGEAFLEDLSINESGIKSVVSNPTQNDLDYVVIFEMKNKITGKIEQIKMFERSVKSGFDDTLILTEDYSQYNVNCYYWKDLISLKPIFNKEGI